jgi:hypothetical protein
MKLNFGVDFFARYFTTSFMELNGLNKRHGDKYYITTKEIQEVELETLKY